ncbi:hypothetical protein CEXT_531781 [Caerostris extrusa]|uniref:Uncharacterized protein n=1 Tax=Caerostris extrusa TaxID=172846 RepID=A0AAV4MYX0_CAEEX|nr:hypothetical protein CEXT_531781 [Caerostris extrusa]
MYGKSECFFPAVDGAPAEDGIQPDGHQRSGHRLPGEGTHQSTTAHGQRQQDTRQERIASKRVFAFEDYFAKINPFRLNSLLSR